MGLKFGSKNRDRERRGGFKYKPLTADYMNQRKNQSGSDRTPYVQPHIKIFSPQAGDSEVRMLPAGWEGGQYGLDVFMHYGIGANRDSYICPKAMGKGKCPICEERAKAEKEGDEDYAASLKVSKRIGVFVIDRAKEGDGPKLWLMPFTLEREMAAQAVDKGTGEVIQFIDPEEGYDFNFEKKGKEKATKYVGAQFDRKPSALSDDEDTMKEWLEYVAENPIPDILVIHPASEIKKHFMGEEAGEDDDGDDRPKKGGLRLGGKKKSGLKIRS
jgi:hypothetical protein